MKVGESMRWTFFTFRQRNREDSIVPAETQAIDSVVAFKWIHPEIVVLNIVRAVVGETENDDLRGGQIRQVGEAVVSVAADNVHRDVG